MFFSSGAFRFLHRIARFLMRSSAAGDFYFNTVDVYNSETGQWSTAQLSVARSLFSATSLSLWNIAFFAGGSLNGA